MIVADRALTPFDLAFGDAVATVYFAALGRRPAAEAPQPVQR